MAVDQPAFACRLPDNRITRIRLGHGSGGRLTADLIDEVFLKHFRPDAEASGEDAAIIQVGAERIAITTDSYVVKPVFFPGGDIGGLAVNGTINDLAMRGAIATHITAAFILEEGLDINELEAIVASMAEACRDGGVEFTAGDTKVVNKGAGDKIFITTTGVGRLITAEPPSSKKAQAGDAVIVSGALGKHGTAVMCARESLNLEVDVESDCAALHTLVSALFATGAEIHCLRDITRGGLATVLNELAASSRKSILIEEKDIPVDQSVASVCELLGLDPLYVACEGRLVCIAPYEHAQRIVSAMSEHSLGTGATVIGRVADDHAGRVLCRTKIGGTRIVDKLSGEQLPRIC